MAGPAMDASVAQLVNGVNDRYAAINSLTATVDFQATTGGARQGKQTDITPFHGYILLRKPVDAARAGTAAGSAHPRL